MLIRVNAARFWNVTYTTNKRIIALYTEFLFPSVTSGFWRKFKTVYYNWRHDELTITHEILFSHATNRVILFWIFARSYFRYGLKKAWRRQSSSFINNPSILLSVVKSWHAYVASRRKTTTTILVVTNNVHKIGERRTVTQRDISFLHNEICNRKEIRRGESVACNVVKSTGSHVLSDVCHIFVLCNGR